MTSFYFVGGCERRQNYMDCSMESFFLNVDAISSRLQNKTNAPDKIAESGHKGVVVELEF
uniref:Uncharacterized protein n=1 Tax=viral metagenome TaxID=1070528 RepID=A0A6C0DNB4_9ZZZZ